MKKLTVLFAVFAMVAMAMPVVADTQWDFYGSSRVFTFSGDRDYADSAVNVQITDAAGNNSDRETSWVGSDSRWGAKVKVSDTLSGRVEWHSDQALRLFYGTWNFGAGSLTVGQHWTPALAMVISNQVGGTAYAYGDETGFGDGMSMVNLGTPYTGRDTGLMVQFGDFKVSLVTPTGGLLGATGEVDYTLPQIEAGYHLALGKAYLDFVAGYNSYDVEDTAVNGGGYDVDSHFLAIGAGVNLGTFYVKAVAWLGENVGSYGMGGVVANDPTLDINNDVNDNDSMGLLLVAGVKMSDMVSFEGGVGYLESELDVTNSNADDNLAFYVQATINLAPGVSITPEIGVVDFGDSAVDDVEQGDFTYFGIRWQINF